MCFGPANITSYKAIDAGALTAVGDTLRNCLVDGPPDADEAPEALLYYYKVEGNKYCVPWADDQGNIEGAGSVEACQARCDEDQMCVAVSYFPAWGGHCYLFDACDEQQA